MGDDSKADDRLREVDHRFKNDLQLIGSIFMLQARRAPDEAARAFARAAQARIGAVAAVHRHLDIGGDPSRIEAAAVVRDVAEEAAMTARRDDVSLELDLASAVLPARQGGPLAIVAGELVRNAFAHAFDGRGGRVRVQLAATDGSVVLEVLDDGDGLADAPRAFGLTLAGLLAQQLRGELSVAAAEPGTRAALRFPHDLTEEA